MVLFFSIERGENMANIKSQVKRIGTNEKSRKMNVAFKSAVRTASKKVRVAVEANDVENARKLLQAAVRLIDKSVSKGIQNKKAAARQKSHLQALVNSINK